MYADLPFGIQKVEDPTFANGVSRWRTSGQYLPGTVSGPQWVLSAIEFTGLAPTVPVNGKRMLRVDAVAPLSAGPGGIAYDFDIPLPAGTYVISTYIRPFNHGGNQDIVVRAGRSDLAVPAIIGHVLSDVGQHTKDLLWNNILGTFTSDGIHPTSILIRNEFTGAYGAFLVDTVAVIPDVSTFQTDLYEQMTPVADQDAVAGFPLKRFVRAYALMFDQVEGYVRAAPDGTPGWAVIVNPMKAPAETLDWLSQLGGTKLPFGSLISEKRRLIDEAPGRKRGTREAIMANVQKYLSGTKYVAMHERTTDDNHFAVGVLKTESPTSEWFTNIVTNANFESNTTAWLNSGGALTGASTLSLDSQAPLYGLQDLKIVATATGNGVRYVLGVLPAGTYGYSFALRGNLGTEVISINVAAVSSADTLPTTWKTYSGTFVSDGVTSYDIMFNTQAPTTAATFFIDGIQVGLSSMAPLAFVDFGVAATTIVKNAVEAERAVGFFQDNPEFLDDPWTYWAISSSIISKIVGGNTVYLPIYATYPDIKRHFTTYADLKNNVAHSWENLIGDFGDPTNEKAPSLGWLTTGSNLNSGATITQDATTPYTGANAGRLTTPGGTATQGMRFDFSAETNGRPGTYSCNIFLRSIGSAATVEVLAGSVSGLTTIFSGVIPTGSWTQIQGQFPSSGGVTADNLVVRIPGTTAATVNFELAAVTPGTLVFPSTF